MLADKNKMKGPIEIKGNPKYQDSFFRMLFKEKRYRKALYLLLHSEDSDVEDSEFENVELDNVLSIDIYNDVCFTVRNRLIILVEHQSTLNRNMPVRIFLYLAEEYKRLFMRSEFSSVLYTAELVKIPRPEFYVVYTGDITCSHVLKLSDAFLDCPPASENAGNGLELSVPVLTADGATGVLAEYFAVINHIKRGKKRLGSLDAAIKSAITEYQSGYEISDFIRSQKGVYSILFEQMSRDELLARQIEATKKVVTQQVTQQVTEQVTQQVTQQVTRDNIAIVYKMLLEAGLESKQAARSIMDNYSLKEEELRDILQK